MSTLNTCTSDARPAAPSAGDTLFETDTKKIITWDGSSWYVYNYNSRIDPAYSDWQLGYSSGLFTSTDYTISVQPIMHFDAAILDGADKANNPAHDASVTTWGDRSGQATDYDATQATGSAQPKFKINGSDKYVYLDGGDYLVAANAYTRASTNPLTVIQVGKASGSGSIYYLAPNVGSSYGSVQLGQYNNGNFYTPPVIASGKDYSTFNMLTFTRDSSNVTGLFRDGGSSEGTGSTSHAYTFEQIGPSGTTKTTGDIYECLLFDEVLSDANLNVINSYLANKYSALPTLTAWT